MSAFLLEHLTEDPTPDDDGDVAVPAAATPTAQAAPKISQIEPAAPLPAPEPIKPLSVFISANYRHRGANTCRCGAAIDRGLPGRFVVFEVHPGYVSSVCDDCARRDHGVIWPLVESLNALGIDLVQTFGHSTPVLAKDPAFSNGVCGVACPNAIESHGVWPVLKWPWVGQSQHEGKCRRCWHQLPGYAPIMAVLEHFLGLAPLPPLAPPPPPPAPSEEEIAAAREAKHRAMVVDVLTSNNSAWRGGTHYSPAAAAEVLLRIIDERAALAGQKAR